MKRLILMRHAKSDWSKAGASDHDRTLNDRGKMNATSLGIWLKEKGLVPKTVLCSTATRTRQTLDMLAVEGTPEIRFEKTLYLADADEILKVLHSAKDDTVLLIGHNPGIAIMAEQMVKTPPNPDGIHHYPTGATIVATFDVDNWADVSWGIGKVNSIVVPRDLPAPT